MIVGGHRIWQGSLDLISFVHEQNLPVSEKTVVVELGCGHGLPGVLMLRQGAKVYFQDLNEDSLSKATIPTIVTNCGPDSISRYLSFTCFYCRTKLICGEWSQTASMIPEDHVDIILASDTIYTPETIRSFISVVNELSQPSTLIFIASQRYYFGLGGGTQALISMIEEMKLPLEAEVVKTMGTDSIKRDIIRIVKK